MLSYGARSRNSCGIDIRLSDDDGDTWAAPHRLISLPSRDNGYPWAHQRDDDKIVMVYYAGEAEMHRRYHMGCLLLDPAEL